MRWFRKKVAPKKVLFVPRNNLLTLLIKEVKLLRIEIRHLKERVKALESTKTRNTKQSPGRATGDLCGDAPP